MVIGYGLSLSFSFFSLYLTIMVITIANKNKISNDILFLFFKLYDMIEKKIGIVKI